MSFRFEIEKDTDNWDPNPNERRWYRSNESGERGYLVRRRGEDKVRLDRPGIEVIRRFDEKEWVLDDRPQTLSLAHLGQIAFGADKGLCRALGLYDKANKDWDRDLKAEDRIAWMKEGPVNPPIRRRLWLAIMETLKDDAS